MGWRSDTHSQEPGVPHLAFSADATLNVHNLFFNSGRDKAARGWQPWGLSTSALGSVTGHFAPSCRTALHVSGEAHHHRPSTYLLQRHQCCSKTGRISLIVSQNYNFAMSTFPPWATTYFAFVLSLLSLVLCLTQHTRVTEVKEIYNRFLPQFPHNFWVFAWGLSKPCDNPLLPFCCDLILAWGKISEIPQSRCDILFPVISFLHSVSKPSSEMAVYLISCPCVSQLKKSLLPPTNEHSEVPRDLC